MDDAKQIRTVRGKACPSAHPDAVLSAGHSRTLSMKVNTKTQPPSLKRTALWVSTRKHGHVPPNSPITLPFLPCCGASSPVRDFLLRHPHTSVQYYCSGVPYQIAPRHQSNHRPCPTPWPSSCAPVHWPEAPLPLSHIGRPALHDPLCPSLR